MKEIKNIIDLHNIALNHKIKKVNRAKKIQVIEISDSFKVSVCGVSVWVSKDQTEEIIEACSIAQNLIIQKINSEKWSFDFFYSEAKGVFPQFKVEDILQDWDMTALLCNRFNHMAKTVDSRFYQLKNILLSYMAKNSPYVWAGKDNFDGLVIYAETRIGQVSFHVMNKKIWETALEFGLNPEGREWEGENLQFVSEELIEEYLEMYGANFVPVKYKMKHRVRIKDFLK